MPKIIKMKTEIYEPIIGLEVHIQVKTKSKMFGRESADYFGKAPNTCVGPVSLGLPGALPVPNRKAIEQGVRLSLALDCNINRETKFDRKNYFYPDLPKGYQISQFDKPLGYDGEMLLESETLSKKIQINRVHLEEDTGKSIHNGTSTLLDFNKAGIPLLEVVTEPDFRTGEEIDLFAKRLRQIVRLLKVSAADMEKGQMRYELNISLRKRGETSLPKYKVEVKNIGSISLLQKVLASEVKRQTEILEKGEIPVQETRGTRDMSGKTYSQRIKENSDDYRYFPDPDIPPIHFTEKEISDFKASLPKLPAELALEYKDLDLHSEIREGIIAEDYRIETFENFRELTNDKALLQLLAKLIMGELALVTINSEESLWDKLTNPELLIALCRLRFAGKLSSNNFKLAVNDLAFLNEKIEVSDLETYLKKINLLLASDDQGLETIVSSEISKDAMAKEKYLKNPNIAMFFVGQIMKQTKGSANPQTVKELVLKILES